MFLSPSFPYSDCCAIYIFFTLNYIFLFFQIYGERLKGKKVFPPPPKKSYSLVMTRDTKSKWVHIICMGETCSLRVLENRRPDYRCPKKKKVTTSCNFAQFLPLIISDPICIVCLTIVPFQERQYNERDCSDFFSLLSIAYLAYTRFVLLIVNV